MPTIYTRRVKPSSPLYSKRGAIQSDLGYILDNSGLGVIINDNSGNRIVVHTGTFYNKTTVYTRRPTI